MRGDEQVLGQFGIRKLHLQYLGIRHFRVHRFDEIPSRGEEGLELLHDLALVVVGLPAADDDVVGVAWLPTPVWTRTDTREVRSRA